jgi:hypothetical protein
VTYPALESHSFSCHSLYFLQHMDGCSIPLIEICNKEPLQNRWLLRAPAPETAILCNRCKRDYTIELVREQGSGNLRQAVLRSYFSVNTCSPSAPNSCPSICSMDRHRIPVWLLTNHVSALLWEISVRGPLSMSILVADFWTCCRLRGGIWQGLRAR